MLVRQVHWYCDLYNLKRSRNTVSNGDFKQSNKRQPIVAAFLFNACFQSA